MLFRSFVDEAKKKGRVSGNKGPFFLGKVPKLPSAARAPAARRGCCSQGWESTGDSLGESNHTGRGLKTLTHHKSGGNFDLPMLEKKDEGGRANSLQTFKGKL